MEDDDAVLLMNNGGEEEEELEDMSDKCYRYDPGSDQWNYLTSMSQKRMDFSTMPIEKDGDFWVVGKI